MKEFSSKEQLLIVSILIAIMEADGVIDPHETEYLDDVITTFGLTEKEITQMDEFDLSFMIEEVRQFDTEKRNRAKSMFLHMAGCDGFTHPKELDIINSLFS